MVVRSKLVKRPSEPPIPVLFVEDVEVTAPFKVTDELLAASRGEERKTMPAAAPAPALIMPVIPPPPRLPESEPALAFGTFCERPAPVVIRDATPPTPPTAQAPIAAPVVIERPIASVAWSSYDDRARFDPVISSVPSRPQAQAQKAPEAPRVRAIHVVTAFVCTMVMAAASVAAVAHLVTTAL
jgi:hypothetical protein